jgi:hypothetical protein
VIPVDQTTFGIPGGNCFSACVASILELPIEDVPYFMDAPEDKWFGAFEPWLAARGYYALYVEVIDGWTPRGLHILSGSMSRRRNAPEHSVVARGSEIVHDPHPDRPGLAKRTHICLIIPLDPTLPRVDSTERQWIPKLDQAVWRP